jgi:prepilin-type processing-associated H-X9-DG protein/prepilin-type N-terminal cleavage/methylation domain-containing protein
MIRLRPKALNSHLACSKTACQEQSAEASRRQCCAAFSLIELLTVIAVIAILTAILIPTIQAIRARVATSTCASNLRQLGATIMIYSIDHEGKLPGPTFLAVDQRTKSTRTLVRVMRDYVPLVGDGDDEMCPLAVCPMADIYYDGDIKIAHYRRISLLGSSSGETFDPFAYAAGSVTMRISQVMETADRSGAEIPIIYDRLLQNTAEGNTDQFVHNGSRNFLFLDGHVQSLPGLNPLEDEGIITD